MRRKLGKALLIVLLCIFIIFVLLAGLWVYGFFESLDEHSELEWTRVAQQLQNQYIDSGFAEWQKHRCQGGNIFYCPTDWSFSSVQDHYAILDSGDKEVGALYSIDQGTDEAKRDLVLSYLHQHQLTSELTDSFHYADVSPKHSICLFKEIRSDDDELLLYVLTFDVARQNYVTRQNYLLFPPETDREILLGIWFSAELGGWTPQS